MDGALARAAKGTRGDLGAGLDVVGAGRERAERPGVDDDDRQRSLVDQTAALKAELAASELLKAQVLDRLLATPEPARVAIYEEQIKNIHIKRIALEEKLISGPAPVADFDSRCRTALFFVATPRKYWDSGDTKRRRLVPKPLFGGRLP